MSLSRYYRTPALSRDALARHVAAANAAAEAESDVLIASAASELVFYVQREAGAPPASPEGACEGCDTRTQTACSEPFGSRLAASYPARRHGSAHVAHRGDV